VRRRFRDLADLVWKQPGSLPAGAIAVLLVVCTLTIVAALVGPHALSAHVGHAVHTLPHPDCSDCIEYEWIDPWSLRNGLAIGLLVWMAAAFLPRFAWSRWVRLAVLLPGAYLISMVVIWERWPVIAPLIGIAPEAPLVESIPIAWTAAAALAWTVVAGRLASSREWVHATVMVALVDVLLVGLWLPIAGRLRASGVGLEVWDDDFGTTLLAPGPLALSVLVPPLVVSFVYTTLALRRQRFVRRFRWLIVGGLATLCGLSLAVRLGHSYGGALVYNNFIHVLLALAAVGVVALAAMGVSLAASARRGRRLLLADPSRRIGTLESDDEPVVAGVEITSWLRGPRASVRTCAVTTNTGDVTIPAGARLVAPLPPYTTHLAVGESIEVLRGGGAVVVSGLVEAPADHPFRGSATLVPGPAGVYIGDVARLPRGFANVALALWRPCLAYLVIVLAVATVGLAGAFTG